MISMSEPAKHCYRAIANFCRFATRKHPTSQSSLSSGSPNTSARGSAGFAMTEMPDTNLPPSSLSTQSTQSPAFVAPPSLAPLTLGDPVSINPASEDITSQHAEPSHPAKSKPSFRKTFSFLSNSHRTHTQSDVLSDRLPLSGSRTPSERDHPHSREDSDAEGYADSPVQENLPEAGPSDSTLDPNFPSDEIKVPSDIPEGFAGNSKVYQVMPFPAMFAHRFFAETFYRMNNSHSSEKECL